MSDGAPNVLLVEDSPEDAFFIRRSLQKSAFEGTVHHVSDGQEAIEYLSGDKEFWDRALYPLPDVVVTDLKMPRVGGFELVQWIRENKDFCDLPVAVLTSSQLDQDRERAEQFGVCAYLPKDILLKDHTDLIHTLRNCGPLSRQAA